MPIESVFLCQFSYADVPGEKGVRKICVLKVEHKPIHDAFLKHIFTHSYFHMALPKTESQWLQDEMIYIYIYIFKSVDDL